MIWPGALPEIDINRLALTDPGALAVSLSEMRLALRADSEDEDQTIQRMIEASTDFFEIRCAWRLTPCSYEALVNGFCSNPITIPRGPLRQVTAVEYWSCDSDEWVMATGDDWTVQPRGNVFEIFLGENTLRALPGSMPYGARQLRITFEAGFDGADSANTSAAGEADSGMIQCLKTLVALEYQKREEATDSERDMIVRRYRKFW